MVMKKKANSKLKTLNGKYSAVMPRGSAKGNMPKARKQAWVKSVKAKRPSTKKK